MAPIPKPPRPTTKQRKPSAPKTPTENALANKLPSKDLSRPAKRTGSKAAAHRKPLTHTPSGVYKSKPKSRHGGGPGTRTPRQRAAELARLEKTLPVLNTIVPATVGVKRKGGNGKVGKVFMGDHDTTRMLRMVEQAAGRAEGGAESKLEKARRLESIRELRRKEEEKKFEERSEKSKARSLKKDKGRKEGEGGEGGEKKMKKKGNGKRVSFA